MASACSKDDSKPPASFTYSVEGVRDLSLPQAGTINMPISVRTASGTAENVSLVVAGVPENVQAGIVPPSGTPDFSTTVTIVAGLNARAGSYPVKLVATSQSGVTVEKAFNLEVRNEDCAMDLSAGEWNGVRTCNTQGAGSFKSTISRNAFPKQIDISNFGNFGSGVTISCLLNCNNGTITAQARKFRPNPSLEYELSGSGTFTASEIRIRMAYADSDRMKDTCTVVYTR